METPSGLTLEVARRRQQLILAFVAMLAGLLLFLDSLWFGPRLAQTDIPLSAQAVEMTLVRAAAMILSLLASAPVLFALVWLASRSRIPATAIPLGVLMSLLVLAVEAGRLHGLAESALGREGPDALDRSFVLAGPVIEEGEKLVAILLTVHLAGVRLGVRPGLVVGAAAGVGFGMTEIGLYAATAYARQEPDALMATIAVRVGFGGYGLHAATAALLGAAVALRRRPVVALTLLVVSVLTHVAWNLFGPGMFAVLVNALSAPTASASPLILWLAALPATALLIGPACIIGAWIWWRSDGCTRSGSPTV